MKAKLAEAYGIVDKWVGLNIRNSNPEEGMNFLAITRVVISGRNGIIKPKITKKGYEKTKFRKNEIHIKGTREYENL